MYPLEAYGNPSPLFLVCRGGLLYLQVMGWQMSKKVL